MNISYYIRELLFSKQLVYLPKIGSFEVESIPAQIDEENGTITPPSKKIIFRDKEGTDYSVLSNYIARNEKITVKKANSEVENFSESIFNALQNGKEFELENIGILRLIGSSKIIFLPLSSYSNVNSSFGFPTISLNNADNIEQPSEVKDIANEAASETAEEHLPQEEIAKENSIEEPKEEKPSQEVQIETLPTEDTPAEKDNGNEEEEAAFELIDDFATEPSTDESEVKENERLEETEVTEEQATGSSIPEIKVVVPSDENLEDLATDDNIPQENSQEAIEITTITSLEMPEERPLQASSPHVIEISSEKTDDDNAVEVKKSRFGWIWTFLVVICVLAIGIVALYHYNPKLFAFILPDKNAPIEIPSIPNESDSSYFKALTGSVKDSTVKDTTTSATEKLSANSDSVKSAPKAITPTEKRKLTSREVEEIINEKLKQGLAENKKADTQKIQKGVTSTPTTQSKKPTSPVPMASTQNTEGSYNVIAASVKSQAEANKVMTSLKEKGYAPKIIEGAQGKIRVSIGSYPNARQAANAARNAKAKLNVDAWVLNPSK